MASIAPRALQAQILAGADLAILDPREEGAYSVAPHLFHSVNLPLSRLELRIGALLPNRGVHIVVASAAGDGLDARMAARLAELGYPRVEVLAGGVQAWQAEGLPAFTGFNTPSKAFGEFVEHECGTPSIAAAELAAWQAEGRDMVIVDSRTPGEHQRGTIPGSISTPGAELVLRAGELAPDPGTTIVVNCAGRTRSIIGAQSLINAGVPNRVVALRNGTMGWKLAGFEIETGSTRRAPAPRPRRWRARRPPRRASRSATPCPPSAGARWKPGCGLTRGAPATCTTCACARSTLPRIRAARAMRPAASWSRPPIPTWRCAARASCSSIPWACVRR